MIIWHTTSVVFHRTIETDEETYCTIAEDNTKSLVNLFELYPGAAEFLRDDDLHLSVHPIKVDPKHQRAYLDYEFDIDGFVTELKKFSAVKMLLHYIMFPKPTIKSIKPVFHLLKKHIVPGHYSPAQFKHFKKSKGIHLAYPQVKGTSHPANTRSFFLQLQFVVGKCP